MAPHFASENRRFPRVAFLALALTVLGAAAMLYYHEKIFLPRSREVSVAKGLGGGYSFGNDFYPVWLTSRECLQQPCDPYSMEMTREIQQGLFGRALDPRIPGDPLNDYRTFAYPAFTDLLLWPAAELSFPIVRVMLAVLLAALTAGSIVLWTRAMSWECSWNWLAVATLLTLGSYPVLEGLYADQLGLFVGFLLAAAMLALQRGRLFLAGALMALTAIKPQMTALALFYLLLWTFQDWRARRSFCPGLFSTGILLVGSALVVWPHWIQSWAHVVAGYHRYAKPPLVRDVLAEPLGTSAAGPATLVLIAILVFAVIALAWRNRRAAADSVEFWITLSVSLAVTTVTLLPGQALHDHVILLPGIFLLASRRKALVFSWTSKMLLAIGVGVLLWPWIAALGLITLRPVLSHHEFYSKAVFVLPLRTAAPFPFVVLGLLALAARRLGSAAPLPGPEFSPQRPAPRL